MEVSMDEDIKELIRLAEQYGVSERGVRHEIERLRRLCPHTQRRVESYYPKLSTEDGEPPTWWSHVVCQDCGHVDSKLEAAPLCPACFTLMQPVQDAERSAKLLDAARNIPEHKYMTGVFLFRCEKCTMLRGFLARIDPKK